MKKSIVIFIAGLFLCNMTCFATNINSSGTNINATETVDSKNKTVSVLLFKPGYSSNKITTETADEALAYSNIAVSNDSYEVSVSIPMPKDCEQGLYHLMIDGKEEPVYYASVEQKKNALAIFDAGDVDKIFNYLESEEKYCALQSSDDKRDVYKTYYNVLSDESQKAVCAKLESFSASATSNVGKINDNLASFSKALDAATLEVFAEKGFSDIKQDLTSENCLDILNKYNKIFEIDFEKSNNVSKKDLSTYLYTEFSGKTNLNAEDVRMAYDTVLVLMKINALTSKNAAELKNIIMQYPKVINIDMSNDGYSKLSESKQNYFLSKMSERDYTTIAEFIDVYKSNLILAEKFKENTGESSDRRENEKYSYKGISDEQGMVLITPSTYPNTQQVITDDFSDLKGYEWAEAAIKSLLNKGIISGVGNNQFAPGEAISREAFVKMTLSVCGISLMNINSEFTDVEEGKWYADSVNTAAKLEIVNGIRENVFGVGKSITRQDAAVILVNAIKTREAIEGVANEASFYDVAQISEYARESVFYLSNIGVLKGKGDGGFDPKGSLTRAETAVLLNRLLQRNEGIE